MSDELKEFSVWRESIQSYWNSKRVASQDFYRNPEYVPRVTIKTIKLKENKFNPVLNRYLNIKEDNIYLQKNTPKPIELPSHKSGVSYNILNLEGSENLDKENIAMSEQRKKFDDYYSQPFDIITNEVYRPEHKAFRIKGKLVYPEKPREYDIVSNKFRLNDEEQKMQEELEQSKKATDFYKIRDFNPVLSTYYHKDKEIEIENSDKNMVDNLYKKKLNGLPVSYKKREPINLNPEGTSNVISDAILYRSTDEDRQKHYGIKYIFEKNAKTNGEILQDREESIKLNRFFAKRFIEEYSNGIDPISLESCQTKVDRLKFARGKTKDHYKAFPLPPKKCVNKYGISF